MSVGKKLIKTILSPISSRWVYTARRGPAKGMRIKGGFLFLPRAEKEDVFHIYEGQLVGQVVFDVGANIGTTTLFFAKQVGPEGFVVAFEPVPSLARRLWDNVQVNNLRNVRLFELALGDTEQRTELAYLPDSSGLSTIRLDLVQERIRKSVVEMIPVKVTTLDSVVERESLPLPNLIKIDVEGFEYQVLLGAQKTLSQARPRLCIEIHSAGPTDESVSKIFTLLQQLGYKIFSLMDGGAEITPKNLTLVRGNLWDCLPD